MLPSLLKVQVERKTCWQLAVVILLLFGAHVTWQGVQDKGW